MHFQTQENIFVFEVLLCVHDQKEPPVAGGRTADRDVRRPFEDPAELSHEDQRGGGVCNCKLSPGYIYHIDSEGFAGCEQEIGLL